MIFFILPPPLFSKKPTLYSQKHDQEDYEEDEE